MTLDECRQFFSKESKTFLVYEPDSDSLEPYRLPYDSDDFIRLTLDVDSEKFKRTREMLRALEDGKVKWSKMELPEADWPPADLPRGLATEEYRREYMGRLEPPPGLMETSVTKFKAP